MQTELATQPPLLMSWHSSISLHTLRKETKEKMQIATTVGKCQVKKIKKVLSQSQCVHWDGPVCWQWHRRSQCPGPEGRWTLQDRTHSGSPVKCWCSERPCDTASQNTVLRKQERMFSSCCSLYTVYFLHDSSSVVLFLHLVHICAVATVALHALGARPTLHPLRRLHALHPRVARVGHAGRTELDPPHAWKQSKSTCRLSSGVSGGVSVSVYHRSHTHRRLHTPSRCSSRTRSPLSARRQLNDHSLHSVLLKADSALSSFSSRQPPNIWCLPAV